MTNPYDILGISPSASDDDVKKAYRELSRKYHPDANVGNPRQAEYEEKFKEVQNAYKAIMDGRKNGTDPSMNYNGFNGGQSGFDPYQAYGFRQENYGGSSKQFNGMSPCFKWALFICIADLCCGAGGSYLGWLPIVFCC